MKSIVLVFALMLGGLMCPTQAGEPTTIAVATAVGSGIGYGIFKGITSFFSAERVLSFAGYEGSIVALQKLPPDRARIVAKDTMMACQYSVQYLQGGVLPTADIVNQVITAKFQNIDPILLSIIQEAATELGKDVPTADIFLTPKEISCLVAFLGPNGMEKGILKWMADNNVSVKIKYTRSDRASENRLKAKKVKGDTQQSAGWFVPNPEITTTPLEIKNASIEYVAPVERQSANGCKNGHCWRIVGTNDYVGPHGEVIKGE